MLNIVYTSRTHIADPAISAALKTGHDVFNASVRTAMHKWLELYNGAFTVPGLTPTALNVVKETCRDLVRLALAVPKEADYIANAFCVLGKAPRPWVFKTARKNALKVFTKLYGSKLGPHHVTTLFANYMLYWQYINKLMVKATIHPEKIISELALEVAAGKLDGYLAVKKRSIRIRRSQRRKLRTFEAKHPEFMTNALLFLKTWETKHGTFRSNRLRWARYLKWLATNQRLIAWRNPNATLHPASLSLINGRIKYRKRFSPRIQSSKSSTSCTLNIKTSAVSIAPPPSPSPTETNTPPGSPSTETKGCTGILT